LQTEWPQQERARAEGEWCDCPWGNEREREEYPTDLICDTLPAQVSSKRERGAGKGMADLKDPVVALLPLVLVVVEDIGAGEVKEILKLCFAMLREESIE
jgi:hypothetical protein